MAVTQSTALSLDMFALLLTILTMLTTILALSLTVLTLWAARSFLVLYMKGGSSVLLLLLMLLQLVSCEASQDCSSNGNKESMTPLVTAIAACKSTVIATPETSVTFGRLLTLLVLIVFLVGSAVDVSRFQIFWGD